jgi:hypothetical protein
MFGEHIQLQRMLTSNDFMITGPLALWVVIALVFVIEHHYRPERPIWWRYGLIGIFGSVVWILFKTYNFDHALVAAVSWGFITIVGLLRAFRPAPQEIERFGNIKPARAYYLLNAGGALLFTAGFATSASSLESRISFPLELISLAAGSGLFLMAWRRNEATQGEERNSSSTQLGNEGP